MYTCRSARVQAAVYCSSDNLLAEQAAGAKLVTAVAPADQAHSQTASASHALAAAREAEISVMRSLQCELRRCDHTDHLTLTNVCSLHACTPHLTRCNWLQSCTQTSVSTRTSQVYTKHADIAMPITQVYLVLQGTCLGADVLERCS